MVYKHGSALFRDVNHEDGFYEITAGEVAVLYNSDKDEFKRRYISRDNLKERMTCFCNDCKDWCRGLEITRADLSTDLVPYFKHINVKSPQSRYRATVNHQPQDENRCPCDDDRVHSVPGERSNQDRLVTRLWTQRTIQYETGAHKQAETKIRLPRPRKPPSQNQLHQIRDFLAIPEEHCWPDGNVENLLFPDGQGCEFEDPPNMRYLVNIPQSNVFWCEKIRDTNLLIEWNGYANSQPEDASDIRLAISNDIFPIYEGELVNSDIMRRSTLEFAVGDKLAGWVLLAPVSNLAEEVYQIKSAIERISEQDVEVPRNNRSGQLHFPFKEENRTIRVWSSTPSITNDQGKPSYENTNLDDNPLWLLITMEGESLAASTPIVAYNREEGRHIPLLPNEINFNDDIRFNLLKINFPKDGINYDLRLDLPSGEFPIAYNVSRGRVPSGEFSLTVFPHNIIRDNDEARGALLEILNSMKNEEWEEEDVDSLSLCHKSVRKAASEALDAGEEGRFTSGQITSKIGDFWEWIQLTKADAEDIRPRPASRDYLLNSPEFQLHTDTIEDRRMHHIPLEPYLWHEPSTEFCVIFSGYPISKLRETWPDVKTCEGGLRLIPLASAKDSVGYDVHGEPPQMSVIAKTPNEWLKTLHSFIEDDDWIEIESPDSDASNFGDNPSSRFFKVANGSLPCTPIKLRASFGSSDWWIQDWSRASCLRFDNEGDPFDLVLRIYTVNQIVEDDTVDGVTLQILMQDSGGWKKANIWSNCDNIGERTTNEMKLIIDGPNLDPTYIVRETIRAFAAINGYKANTTNQRWGGWGIPKSLAAMFIDNIVNPPGLLIKLKPETKQKIIDNWAKRLWLEVREEEGRE